MKKNDNNELLNALCNISIISETKEKKNGDEIFKYRFSINNISLTIFFVYESAVINIWKGNNFDTFVFIFKNGSWGANEIKEIEKFISTTHLPPNLIIQEINKIGVKEL